MEGFAGVPGSYAGPVPWPGEMPRGRAGMDLTTERCGDVLTVGLSGRLDSAGAAAFAEALEDAIARTDRAVILDFGGVDVIGSTALRVVLVTAKDLRRRDTSLILCALSDSVRHVLRVTGYDRILPVHGTGAEALASLEG